MMIVPVSGCSFNLPEAAVSIRMVPPKPVSSRKGKGGSPLTETRTSGNGINGGSYVKGITTASSLFFL